MQVNTHSGQWGLGSELVDWCWHATSVPYGHLLMPTHRWSPRKTDRLRFCRNTGSTPSKFYIPDQLEQSKILVDEHTKSFYSPSAPLIFPQMKTSFPPILPKIFYPVSLRMHNESAQTKPAKHNKTSRGKFSKRDLTIVSKTYNSEAKKRHSVVRRRLIAQKCYYSSRH